MKVLTVSALFCALMTLTTADGEGDIVKRSGSCLEGWIPFRGSCFGYDARAKTWADAKKDCQAYDNGDLASVHSFDELLNIRTVIKKWTAGKSPLAWLGGSDARQAGNWVWSDGSSVSSSYWAPGQPDRSGNCLMINFGDQKKLANWPCGDVLPSVCEIKP